jgi:NAD(P)-dependent dehydrogenase (short-subunit alcohol dehydrogenase family)
LSNENNIIDVCANIKEKYTKIDLLINNAALSLDNNFLDKTKDEFMKVLEVNLVGPFLLIQKLNDLFNLEQDLSIHIFKLEGFDGIDLTYQQLSNIMFMIEE